MTIGQRKEKAEEERSNSDEKTVVQDTPSDDSDGSDHICVHCGDIVGPLFVEYSERNFRLTRCPRCNKIADKYIEYELLLVLMDIILHEDSAFYHLLYNRYSHTITQRAKRWLPVMVIIISILVKVIVFHHSIYQKYSLFTVFHLIGGSVCDIGSYLIVLSCCWNYFHFFSTPSLSVVLESSTEEPSSATTSASTSPDHNRSSSRGMEETQSHRVHSSSFLRFYFAILFPEIFKIAIIILYVFDTTANLLFLLNTIIVTLQWTAIRCITRIELPLAHMKGFREAEGEKDRSNQMLYQKLFVSFVIAIVCRILANTCFYSIEDLFVLAGFS